MVDLYRRFTPQEIEAHGGLGTFEELKHNLCRERIDASDINTLWAACVTLVYRAKLPFTIVVSGSVTCKVLNSTILPPHLVIEGNLDLRGTNIKYVPEGIHVKGRLWVPIDVPCHPSVKADGSIWIVGDKPCASLK